MVTIGKELQQKIEIHIIHRYLCLIQELLYKFLRSCDMVGVATVKAFQDLLTRIQYVYVAANQDLRILADMLLASVVRIVSER